MKSMLLAACGPLAFVLLGCVLTHAPHAHAEEPPTKNPTPSISFYQQRYPLKDPYSKLIDNEGNGFSALYGTRNLRSVLNGVVYRGGANNAFNIHGKRSNMNPLPDEGLTHLCEEGFKTAVYLYPDRYSTAPKITRCETIFGTSGQLDYLDHPPLSSSNEDFDVLKLVYERLTSTTDTSPIYLHCWNGWHASGFISALILRQFCDVSAEAAVNYWNKNTDGHDGSSFEGIRRKIRAFVPYSELVVNSEIKAQVCP